MAVPTFNVLAAISRIYFLISTTHPPPLFREVDTTHWAKGTKSIFRAVISIPRQMPAKETDRSVAGAVSEEKSQEHWLMKHENNTIWRDGKFPWSYSPLGSLRSNFSWTRRWVPFFSSSLLSPPLFPRSDRGNSGAALVPYVKQGDFSTVQRIQRSRFLQCLAFHRYNFSKSCMQDKSLRFVSHCEPDSKKDVLLKGTAAEESGI